MKVKSGFVLHTVGTQCVAVPVGERAEEFHGMVKLSESGAYLWEFMLEDFTVESLVTHLLARYTNITEDFATEEVKRFLKPLIDAGIIEV